MTLDYNIFLEVAVIPLDIVLCIFLVMRYTNPTKVNIAFRRFAFCVLFADMVDVATAVVTSAHEAVPNPVHYLFNTADSILAALSGFLFIYYVYAYADMDRTALRWRDTLNKCLLALDILLLLTNPLTGWVFTYDAGGKYIHQALFVPVAYGFPILFFAIGSAFMLIHRENYKPIQVKVMLLSIVTAAILFLSQMLFYDNVLITFFVASIGVLVIFLSLETPDYVELVRTLTELHETQAREAAAQAKVHLSQEVMMALSKAVDAKDHYTNGHSERVAKYSRLIMERLGGSKKDQDDIYAMGLLHDIGKIGVQESIINKKGSLTDEEFENIKSHTMIGWDILKTITEIPGLSTGARWHHERYEGGGYPDGLAGDDIPFEARIICVADSYDAMTSKRSYSHPKPQAEVREELLRCSGTQFDPEVAAAMIELIDEDDQFLLREEE